LSEIDGYRRVAEVSDVPQGTMIKVRGIDIVETCILNHEGKLYAFSNVCTHKGGPLNEGFVKRDCIVCPWHSANFRLRDGKNTWPAPREVRSFQVKVVGNSIYVKR
jgi:nitrite reductase (NADH) small subunit